MSTRVVFNVIYRTHDSLLGVGAAKIALSLGKGHRVVTILCDSGTRHLSKFWAKAGNVGGSETTKLEDVLNATQEES